MGEVEVGVASGDDEGEEGGGGIVRLGVMGYPTHHLRQVCWADAGCLHRRTGVDVAFEVVDGDEGLVEAEGESFGVGDADEQTLRRGRGLR